MGYGGQDRAHGEHQQWQEHAGFLDEMGEVDRLDRCAVRGHCYGVPAGGLHTAGSMWSGSPGSRNPAVRKPSTSVL